MLPGGCVRRLPRKRGKVCSLSRSNVLLYVGVKVLNEHLAAERLAEERQVRSDDGPEIEEHGSILRLERAQKLSERLRGLEGRLTRGRRRDAG